jgi:peptidoglycan/LPS O-acetylase OafA/YrhL
MNSPEKQEAMAHAISGEKAAHRPEIQGLRAVAALLVASYHIWFGRVSGGVDVFIVVSAFLITTSLVSRYEAKGHIDFLAFWGGLVRRLVPAAFVVLIAVLIASVLWVPRGHWIDTYIETAASAFYVENWRLAFTSVDYLARDPSTSPLRHYWALSIQGQCYLLWPLLITALAWLAARRRLSFRVTAFAGIATLFAISLTYSIVTTDLRQSFAYFDTFARMWEFSLGALLALALPWVRLPPLLRFVAGWIGLIAILACGAILQVSKVFPGYAALWPTLSAVLILIAHQNGIRFGADRLLSTRLLTWIGDRSYGLYLWHWPVFIFYRILVERHDMTLFDGVVIIGIAMLLTTLTTRYVENPVRFRRTADAANNFPLRVGIAWGTPLVALLFAWGAYISFERHENGRPIALNDPNYPGAAVVRLGKWIPSKIGVPVHPGPLAVKNDRPAALDNGCFQNLYESEPVQCVHGDANSDKVIAVVGGSHSAHWVPALERAAEQNDWKIITYTKNRCLFTSEVGNVFNKRYVSCQVWNENVLRELQRKRPDIVFTTATVGIGPAERIPPGFVTQWRKVTALGIRVVAIRDTPRFPFDVPECVEKNGPYSKDCQLNRMLAFAAKSPFETSPVKIPGVHLLDLNNYFCNPETCPPVIGNLLVYSDDSHITTHYARTLAPMLSREMARVMK